MAKVKKAQTGKNVPKGMVESEMYPGKMIPKAKSNYESGKMAKSVASAKSSVAKPKAVMPKKKMKDGGALKPVAADQKGLAKLPTPVRNKMGYQKDGGKMKAKSGAKMGKCKYGCK